jgi:arginine/lysine/ornithine decarboxylase
MINSATTNTSVNWSTFNTECKCNQLILHYGTYYGPDYNTNQVQEATTHCDYTFTHVRHNKYNKQWTTSVSIKCPYSAPSASAISSLHTTARTVSTHVYPHTGHLHTYRTDQQPGTTTRIAHICTHTARTPWEDTIQPVPPYTKPL